MARQIAEQGTKFTIAFANTAAGSSPAYEFFRDLPKVDQAKLMALFRLAGAGSFANPQKFGDLGGGLHEFKSFQIRMPFGYAKERGLIVITHGFIKKCNKAPKEEIARARRILQEDQEPRLTLVKKAKR